jgi:NAD(P)-dependent dehydrogenase (short-subunit alcohol dehydrogenase family)
MTSSSEFSGRAVAIVGGSVGVGPAVVQAFLDHGAHVASGERAAEPPAGLPPGARPFALQLEKPASVVGFLDRCEAELGGLDVLVMSPSPVKVGKVLETSPEDIRRVIGQELTDVALCLQEAARRMAARRGGRIISFVSMSGKTGVHPGVGPYAAAKGGVIAFSRVLAAELAASGVTVNCIATALFEPQVAVLPEEHRREVLKGVPVGRFGRSEEAAQAVLYLASRNAGYVTGETLNLSGGRFMD